MQVEVDQEKKSITKTASEESILKLGIDIGSTTIKAVVSTSDDEILYSSYRRHFSDTVQSIIDLGKEIYARYPSANFKIAVAGSGALGIAQELDFLFVQEVVAATKSIKKYIPQTDVAIELGGEDGKITFFDKNGIDQRMNETCAGGTGAFIDQMSALLKTDAIGLNELAKNYTNIYSIAARCGVFAKTDIMPLLNEGAPKENIAVSIFQAVVDQTIGGLACGHIIKGNIAFLGGPLSFLSELRKRFIKTLKLTPEQVIFPKNSQYFVALGAALLSDKAKVISSNDLIVKLNELKKGNNAKDKPNLAPLFNSEEEYKSFLSSHDTHKAEFIDIKDAKGDVFLGLDAGSTTTKAVLINDENQILYSWYAPNNGNPLLSAINILKDIYSKLPSKVNLKYTGVTGYGEGLIKTALGFDVGEVETIAHYRSAKYFMPDVSFILDIGGQDMKCIYIKNNNIDKIVLNEACSSGCGSFLSTFAESLSVSIPEFVNKALYASTPVDLGSRCTVFMNSKIKQSQKEGASLGDISAGLAYSVIKNALYKVIKISSPEALGNKIIVQGGTFYNDAVLRAFENIIGCKAVRPNIAGLMGAFGIALIAKERSKEENKSSNIIDVLHIDDFKIDNKTLHCGLCQNNCLLTVSKFSNGKKFISGNRCERGAGALGFENTKAFNMFNYKYERLFNYYTPLPREEAKRGEIGIPRVLNMYEDYPFWFTLFTSLGFRVVLSEPSSRTMFNTGLESITSQTLCYPAKMVHGHIVNLIKKGVKNIFYPCLPYEHKEFKDAHANFNCPVVTSYPEVVRLNMDCIKENGIKFFCPFLPFHNTKKMHAPLIQILSKFGVSHRELSRALKKAEKEEASFRKEIRETGRKIVQKVKKENGKAIVLAGRPYHLDPIINHGIPSKITSEGIPVLTEDSVAHLGENLISPLRVVDQWSYHSRLYRAANFVAQNHNFELVQLNSFGCGIDAITTEQVEEILSSRGKIYTLLKIDEGANLGAVVIRIRSLLATMNTLRLIEEKKETNPKVISQSSPIKELDKGYTILCPEMSPLHFTFIHDAFKPTGVNLEVLPKFTKQMIDEGLSYVNNDACYPAIVVIGQLISALKSGKYDPKKTALIISQTGGGCRATNYVALLKSATKRAGFPDVPILTLNMQNRKKSALKLNLATFNRLIIGFVYGDLIMRLSNSSRPYEIVKGSVNALVDKWQNKIKESFTSLKYSDFVHNLNEIVKDFDSLPLDNKEKPKVGIVGEILVKFHPGANNHLIDLIEEEGGEAVVPDFLDFVIYVLFNSIYNHKYLAGKLWKSILSKVLISFIEKHYRQPLRNALNKSKRFKAPLTTKELSEKASQLLSVCNQMGEGWLLTAEMMELIESGVPNIVCVQPFGCLPNHIVGKGVIKSLKKLYEQANIVAIDYDAGTSDVNQINRIKLMMSVAKD